MPYTMTVQVQGLDVNVYSRAVHTYDWPDTAVYSTGQMQLSCILR